LKGHGFIRAAKLNKTKLQRVRFEKLSPICQI